MPTKIILNIKKKKVKVPFFFSQFKEWQPRAISTNLPLKEI